MLWNMQGVEVGTENVFWMPDSPDRALQQLMFKVLLGCYESCVYSSIHKTGIMDRVLSVCLRHNLQPKSTKITIQQIYCWDVHL